MKKIILVSFILMTFQSFAQDREILIDTIASYDRWSIEFNVGQNKAIKPFAAGYYSSDPTRYFNFSDVNHFDFGLRYMFSTKFGLKMDFAFDKVKNQSSSGSLPFEIHQYRVGVQGVANFGRIMNFESFTSRVGLLGHAGIQVSQVTPKMGVNTGVSEDNGGIMLGLSPQFKITESLVLSGDFSFLSNVRQHFNWDGSYSTDSNNLSGAMYNTSLGLTLYLGSNDKHADWYIERDRLNDIKGKDIEARDKIAKIEKMLEDTDRDGVPDYRDAENNTPNGIVVDAKGRFIDINRNGVPDELETTGNDGKDGKQLVSKEDAMKVLIEKGYVNVFFDINKAYPNSGSTNNIYQIINFLRNYPDAKATLRGYADVRGNEAKNVDLSNRRAQKMYEIIVASGIESSRLKIVGEGVDNTFPTTQIGLDLARRVSFKLE